MKTAKDINLKKTKEFSNGEEYVSWTFKNWTVAPVENRVALDGDFENGHNTYRDGYILQKGAETICTPRTLKACKDVIAYYENA